MAGKAPVKPTPPAPSQPSGTAAAQAAAAKAAAARAASAKKGQAKRGRPKGRGAHAAHHHRTKAQIAGAKRAGQTRHKHHMAQLAATRGKKPKATAKKPTAPVIVDLPDLEFSPVPDGPYGAGLHVLPVCAAVAVAEHLAAFTGITAWEDEILGLHYQAGLLSLSELLEYLQAEGFAGARLRSFRPCDETLIAPGLVCGLQVSAGYHAVLAHPAGMISWGTVLPWTAAPAEAWALEWETG